MYQNSKNALAGAMEALNADSSGTPRVWKRENRAFSHLQDALQHIQLAADAVRMAEQVANGEREHFPLGEIKFTVA